MGGIVLELSVCSEALPGEGATPRSIPTTEADTNRDVALAGLVNSMVESKRRETVGAKSSTEPV